MLRVDAANVEAQGNIGVLLYFKGDCAAATPPLSAALAAQPAAGQIRALVGLCQAQAGRTAEAEANLRAALPTVSNPRVRKLVMAQVTQLAYSRGDLQQASADVAELIKADPGAPDTLYLAYRIYTDMADSARNTLATAAPESARMHQLTAQRFINTGNAVLAERQYRLALEKDPGLAGVHFELGEAIMQESVTEDSRARARAEFESALKQDPRDAGSEAKLGLLESIAGNSPAAEAHFRRALALHGDELDALVGLGEIEHRRGNDTAALDCLQRASRVSALDDTLHFRLAQIYRAQGNRAAADREIALQKQILELKGKTSLDTLRRTSPE